MEEIEEASSAVKTTAGPVDLRSVVFLPVASDSLVEQVERRLKDGIRSSLLKEGDRLPPEVQLAEWFGVSPMTLRGALDKLRRAGYLETRRGRTGGTFVRQSLPASSRKEGRRTEDRSSAHLNGLIEYRRAIVTEAAALAAERADLEEVETLARQADEIGAVTGWVEYVRVDAEFHNAILSLAGSKRLLGEQTITDMEIGGLIPARRDERFLNPEQLSRLVDDHVELLGAIKDRQSRVARNVAGAHAKREGDALLAHAQAD